MAAAREGGRCRARVGEAGAAYKQRRRVVGRQVESDGVGAFLPEKDGGDDVER